MYRTFFTGSKNNSGRTPLHGAAREGHLDQLVNALQASGQKLSIGHFLIKDNHGSTPLHQAACYGHLDQVLAALAASNQKLSLGHFLIQDDEGETPLDFVVWNGHLDQVFNPSYWTGRVKEMIDLWKEVTEQYKKGFDFKKLRDEAILLSVQSVPRLDLQALSQAMRAGNSFSQNSDLLGKERGAF